MLKYTLQHDDETQALAYNTEGALIIESHEEGDESQRRPVLHVLRESLPFRFDAPTEPGQVARAQDILIALRLLPFIVASEDSGADVVTLSASIADRARAWQHAGLTRVARQVTAEVYGGTSAERQVAENEMIEEEACE